jgi:hypothetical protein
MHKLSSFFVDHSAPPYYYIKKNQTFIDIGIDQHQQELFEIAKFCKENKNPLTLAVPGTEHLSHNIKIPHYYSWPLPFCFTWKVYRNYATEGLTLYRLASNFWNNINLEKIDELHPEGFSVSAAEVILLPPGTKTLRVHENPGGHTSHRWWAGGSCRLMIGVAVNEGSIVHMGDEEQLLELNCIYEVNNNKIGRVSNNGTTDMVYMTIDLVPNGKAEELESRILKHKKLCDLHVKFAAGFPSHTTLHL